jgi:hypothetical protein
VSIDRINARWAETHGDTIFLFGGTRFLALNQPRRRLLHWLVGCTRFPKSDEHGVWMECAICERVDSFLAASPTAGGPGHG